MQSSRSLPFSCVLACAAAGACGGGKGPAVNTGSGNAPGVACGDSAPWVSSGAPQVSLAVDAASPGATWSRFYEGAVATDHANTILTAAWGRNAQAALKKVTTRPGFATRASTAS